MSGEQTSKKYGKMNGQVNMKKYCIKLNQTEATTLLKARLGMTKIRTNYKNMYDTTICPVCNKENETLEHLLKCNTEEIDEAQITNYIHNIQNISIQNLDNLNKIAILIATSLVSRASTLEASPPPVPVDGDILEMMDIQ